MSVELTKKQKLVFLAAATFMPLGCMSIELDSGNIQLYAQVFSLLNIGLFVTSVISIKQYFFPGDENRMPFHVFNLIFGALFYGISLPYLILNKEYYEGYQQLIPLDIIGKFFFSFTLSAASQWVILLSFVINVLYVKKYNNDYYESGMGLTVVKERETIESTAITDVEEPTETTEIPTNTEHEVESNTEEAPNSEEDDSNAKTTDEERRDNE